MLETFLGSTERSLNQYSIIHKSTVWVHSGTDTGFNSGECEILIRKNYRIKEKRKFLGRYRAKNNLKSIILELILMYFRKMGKQLGSFFDFKLMFFQKKGKKYWASFCLGAASHPPRGSGSCG